MRKLYYLKVMNFCVLTAALTCFVATAKAEVSYLCIELDRVSVSAEGLSGRAQIFGTQGTFGV